jgi:hypothetical protein
MPARLYRKARKFIRSPHFWPSVQVFALVVSVLLMGYIVWISSTEKAAREARVDADNRAAVQECFSRNAQGPAAQRFFEVLAVILRNQRVLARAGITATEAAPDTVRQFKLVSARATASLADLRSFKELSETTTPTRKECTDMAKRLDVRLPQ